MAGKIGLSIGSAGHRRKAVPARRQRPGRHRPGVSKMPVDARRSAAGLVYHQPIALMRLLPVILTLVLLTPATAGAQEFYRLYEQGVSAYDDGKLDEAKDKLTAAKAKSAKQGQRIFFYGLRYDEYVPDYYLGLIALQEKRYPEALRLLENVESAKLLSSRDKQKNQALTQALGTLRAQTKVQPPTPGGTSKPPVNPPAPPPWQADFQRALAAGEQALRDRRYADARNAATTARPHARDARTQSDLAGFERRVGTEEGQALAGAARNALASGNDAEAQRHIDRLASVNPQFPGIDALRAELGQLRRRRESDQIAGRARQALSGRNRSAASQEIGRLASTNPKHPSLPGLRSDLARLEAALKAVTADAAAAAAAAADVARRRVATERDTMRLYLLGDYDRAQAQILAFVEEPTPRMQLYLACSQAALALLRGDAELAAEARRTYGAVKADTAKFAADFRYISPAVQKLLEGGAL